jgi:hypothetical protein
VSFALVEVRVLSAACPKGLVAAAKLAGAVLLAAIV